MEVPTKDNKEASPDWSSRWLHFEQLVRSRDESRAMESWSLNKNFLLSKIFLFSDILQFEGSNICEKVNCQNTTDAISFEKLHQGS
jgi:hypothetical protein